MCVCVVIYTPTKIWYSLSASIETKVNSDQLNQADDENKQTKNPI